MAHDWQIKMLFDGQCPVCSREAAVLQRCDRRGHIVFEDIAAPGFDPACYGLTMPQVIAAMHVVRRDGSVVCGIDALAELYDAVGWTWLARLLRWRPIRPLAQAGYRLFAAIRPRLSGFRHTVCVDGRCR